MSETLTTSSGIHITSKGRLQTPETATDVVALLECSDYYLAHPPMQPKREIADYIESQGFLVPRRYQNLEEALASGKDFIMRSEHPQDYDGISGLFESQVYYARDGEIVVNNPTREEILNDQKSILSLERVQEYCKEKEIGYEQFISQASFEYWEYIEGENLTLVRDEVVEGRYHIFVNGGGGSDYICYDAGDITQGYIPDGIGIGSIEKLIEQYENISHLARFDELQCPNIEFQIGNDGNIYFLQYKRGHQKQIQKWSLDRELEEGEMEASFVRGATKPGGEIVEIFHRQGYTFDSSSKEKVYNPHSIIPEYYLKDEVVVQYDDINSVFLQQHGFVTHISQTGICLSVEKTMKNKHVDDVCIELWLEAVSDKIPYIGLRISIVSDGTKAYYKTLDTPKTLFERAIKLGYPEKELKDLLSKYI